MCTRRSSVVEGGVNRGSLGGTPSPGTAAGWESAFVVMEVLRASGQLTEDAKRHGTGSTAQALERHDDLEHQLEVAQAAGHHQQMPQLISREDARPGGRIPGRRV